MPILLRPRKDGFKFKSEHKTTLFGFADTDSYIKNQDPVAETADLSKCTVRALYPQPIYDKTPLKGVNARRDGSAPSLALRAAPRRQSRRPNRLSMPICRTPPFELLPTGHIRQNPHKGGFVVYGPPGEIRTPDTQVRSLVLYPAELRAEACSIGNSVNKRQRESACRRRIAPLIQPMRQRTIPTCGERNLICG